MIAYYIRLTHQIRIPSMIKNYIRSSLAFLLFFLFPTMAFANGGLPIWINTIQSVAATSGIRGLGGLLSSSVITLICLMLIIFCETLFLKKRYFTTTSTAKIIEAVSVSNIVSTVLGGVFLLEAFYIAEDSHSLGYLLLGPLYGILADLPHNSIAATSGFVFILVFYNVFFCFFSYFIERFITKKYLQSAYSNEVISKGILRANILSYAMSFFLMLPIYIMLHGILRI